MLERCEELTIAADEEIVALRLLSALVMGWDLVPIASQLQIVRDACLVDRTGEAVVEPEAVLDFIKRYKDRPL